MIVGKSDVSIDELLGHISSVEEFCRYSDSLVPEIFRSVAGIVGNQRYLCCLVIRNSDKVSWDTKKKVLPLFFSKSKLCGYVDYVIEAHDLLDMSSEQKIIQYGKMEGRDVSSLFCKADTGRMSKNDKHSWNHGRFN